MDNKMYEYYVDNLGDLITEYGEEAYDCYNSAVGTDGEIFSKAYLESYLEIISLVKNHGESHGFTSDELGLGNTEEISSPSKKQVPNFMKKKDYKTYIKSLSSLLMEHGRQAKNESEKVKFKTKNNRNYANGRLCAYYRVLTLMDQHYEPYGLTKEQVGLENFKENDFI